MIHLVYLELVVGSILLAIYSMNLAGSSFIEDPCGSLANLAISCWPNLPDVASIAAGLSASKSSCRRIMYL